MFCDRVKEFLTRNGVDYQERDILKDESAIQGLSDLGYMTTPVITVGEAIVVGFNQKRLEELLGL